MKSHGKPAPPAGADWTRQPERGSLFWLRVMTWISLRFGRAATRILLYPTVAYFLAFAPAACRHSRRYLQRALELPSPADVGWEHLFRHLLRFASVVHDRIYLINGRFELFDIRVHNQALMDRVLAEQHGAFLIGAHLGSFEVLRAIGSRQTGLRVAMAMYGENARKVNAVLAAINPDARQDIIPLGHIDSMIQIHQALDQGAVVGMLADRSPGNSDTRPVDFLGDPAALPLGPFRMAAVMKRPVLFMTGLYRGGNRYDIHFDTLADFSIVAPRGRALAVQAAMTRYAALVEHYCRASPYNWFNFFDFWRPPVPRPSRHAAPTP